MHVAFGDHAFERSRHAQVRFELADALRGIASALLILFPELDPRPIGIHRFLCDVDIVPGDYSRCRRRCLEPLVGGIVGRQLRLRLDALRLGAPNLRLRLASLRNELGRREPDQQLSLLHGGPTIHCHCFHEAGNLGTNLHVLKCHQISGQRDGAIEEL